MLRKPSFVEEIDLYQGATNQILDHLKILGSDGLSKTVIQGLTEENTVCFGYYTNIKVGGDR